MVWSTWKWTYDISKDIKAASKLRVTCTCWLTPDVCYLWGIHGEPQLALLYVGLCWPTVITKTGVEWINYMDNAKWEECCPPNMSLSSIRVIHHLWPLSAVCKIWWQSHTSLAFWYETDRHFVFQIKQDLLHSSGNKSLRGVFLWNRGWLETWCTTIKGLQYLIV